jgi:hypothetical protein
LLLETKITPSSLACMAASYLQTPFHLTKQSAKVLRLLKHLGYPKLSFKHKMFGFKDRFIVKMAA